MKVWIFSITLIISRNLHLLESSSFSREHNRSKNKKGSGNSFPFTTSFPIIMQQKPPYTYVDEMSNTIFKRWKYSHVFHKINENQTKITDEIEFELQYGFIGKMFERYALDKLEKIFAHRQQATINALSNPDPF